MQPQIAKWSAAAKTAGIQPARDLALASASARSIVALALATHFFLIAPFCSSQSSFAIA
jgi:hypothetical protein